METFLKGLAGGLFITGVVVTLVAIATVFFVWLLWEKDGETAPQSNYLELSLYKTSPKNPSLSEPTEKLFLSCTEQNNLCQRVLQTLPINCKALENPQIDVHGYYNEYIREEVVPGCSGYKDLEKIIGAST